MGGSTMLKVFRALAAAALLVAVGAAPKALAQTKTTIRIANLDIGPFVPVAYVAKLADKYNLDVKITNFRRGLEASQALKAGEADVAVGGVEAAISAIAGGSPAIIVSGVSTRGVAWGQGTQHNNKTHKVWKGRRFALFRGRHDLVRRVAFKQAGLTMSTEAGKADVQVMYINSPPAL